MLQIFWEEGAQHYPFVSKLTKYLHAKESFIPFADVHHLTISKRIIKDPHYIEIVDRIRNKLEKNISENQEPGSQGSIDV